MWRWSWELEQSGFRRLSDHYWQCRDRFDLPEHAYLSLFADAGTRWRWRRPGRARDRPLEVQAFHVTFTLGVDHLHFYDHEHSGGVWEPGGHTSAGEIRRHGVEPGPLRELADAVAAALLLAWGESLRPRRGRAVEEDAGR